MSKNIKLPEPTWNSELAHTILQLEKLRNQRLYSKTVRPYTFFQLKKIFQILETLGSARIEGNNTTLSEYVEEIIEQNVSIDEERQGLDNLEEAIGFIEENTNEETEIDRAYLSHLHTIVTQKLTPPTGGEGSNFPGELRPHNVKIEKSDHTPPLVENLQEYFDYFLNSINADCEPQNQLLMVAIAHHRFMYIHPFDNGNGRMGRMLNYALLIKLGFNVKAGRIINPSSVFYSDRDKYYEMLSAADSLSDDDLMEWSLYFLLALKKQIENIDKLLEIDFVRNKILTPTLKFALDRENITKLEFEILSYIVKKEDMSIKASELNNFGIHNSSQKSYIMGKLREKKMVMPIKPNGRVYTIHFANNYLLRGIIKNLQQNGFIAEFLEKN